MALKNKQIVDIIEKGASSDMKNARKIAKKINMHLTGKGIKEYLEVIDTYENTAQKTLREKLVKSNRALFSYLLRPMDKIFTAKGGSINFNLEAKELDTVKGKLTEASDGMDIKRYLKKVVRLPYIIDANGILFVDIDPQGNLEPHIIYSKQILWYDNKGNTVKAIIFEGVKVDRGDKEGRKDVVTEYRVIDEKYDMIYVADGKTLKEDKSRRIKNFFGYVPAIILGDEKDPNSTIYTSQVYDILDEADLFLRRSSTMNVHELAHLYSRYWSYAQACTRCEGEGLISSVDDQDAVTSSTCPSCGGSGAKTRTNASDETVLPLPQDGEPIIAPHIAGYVSPDIQIAKFYSELQDNFRNEMFQDIWGTTYEGGGKRETATGRFIDAKPVEDKLRDMSYTFEKLHQFLLNTFIQAITRNLKYESSVAYGTRYILESADEILNKRQELSGKQVSEVIVLDLEQRYIEAEYQTDSVELKKRKKLMKIEPYPTLTILQVMNLMLPDEDKLRKLYFADFVSTLTDAKIILTPSDKLREQLNKFIINKKIKENEQTEPKA